MVNKKQDGFTLIEAIIVLTIVTLILPISLRHYVLLSERQKLKSFVGQLADTIHLAQMTAIAEDRYVDVELNNNTHAVEVWMGMEKIKRLDVSEGIIFDGGTRGLNLRYTSDGALVGNAGTIFVNTEHYSERFVFLVGQGRFYVQAG